MVDFSHLKYASMAVIFTSILDFAVNIIYAPYITSSTFIVIILSMSQIVTILFQFFSLFFLMNMISEVRYGGYASGFIKFFPLIITGSLYLLVFLINIIAQFALVSKDNDIYSLWNNGVLMTFWAIQKLVSNIHYAFSIYFTVRMLTNSAQFL